MQSNLEHRLRKHDLHVDAHRLDGAAHQREIPMLAVRRVDILTELDLVRDAPMHVLKRQPRRMVAERDILRIRPRRRHRLAVAPQHGVLDVIQHLGPRVELDVVRVHIDDEVVLQVVALDVAPRVREDFARVGACRDLLRLARPNSRAFRCLLTSVSPGFLSAREPHRHVERGQILRAEERARQRQRLGGRDAWRDRRQFLPCSRAGVGIQPCRRADDVTHVVRREVVRLAQPLQNSDTRRAPCQTVTYTLSPCSSTAMRFSRIDRFAGCDPVSMLNS